MCTCLRGQGGGGAAQCAAHGGVPCAVGTGFNDFPSGGAYDNRGPSDADDQADGEDKPGSWHPATPRVKTGKTGPCQHQAAGLRGDRNGLPA